MESPELVSWRPIVKYAWSCGPHPHNSSECERGFSGMKRVKTDWRASLKTSTLSDLMLVLLEGPSIDDFNPLRPCQLWADQCDRRPKKVSEKERIQKVRKENIYWDIYCYRDSYLSRRHGVCLWRDGSSSSCSCAWGGGGLFFLGRLQQHQQWLILRRDRVRDGGGLVFFILID